jgi:hypothetical protein
MLKYIIIIILFIINILFFKIKKNKENLLNTNDEGIQNLLSYFKNELNNNNLTNLKSESNNEVNFANINIMGMLNTNVKNINLLDTSLYYNDQVSEFILKSKNITLKTNNFDISQNNNLFSDNSIILDKTKKYKIDCVITCDFDARDLEEFIFESQISNVAILFLSLSFYDINNNKINNLNSDSQFYLYIKHNVVSVRLFSYATNANKLRIFLNMNLDNNIISQIIKICNINLLIEEV